MRKLMRMAQARLSLVSSASFVPNSWWVNQMKRPWRPNSKKLFVVLTKNVEDSSPLITCAKSLVNWILAWLPRTQIASMRKLMKIVLSQWILKNFAKWWCDTCFSKNSSLIWTEFCTNRDNNLDEKKHLNILLIKMNKFENLKQTKSDLLKHSTDACCA